MQGTNKNIQRKKSSRYYALFKWLVLVGSYAFLFYKLYHFEYYADLKTELFSHLVSNSLYLLFVFLLLPINWLIESYKWQYLCQPFEKISLSNAVKSVLGALPAGFLTPNRVGEIVGRPLFLQKENRITGGLMTIVNSFSQTITIIACGIPSAMFFFLHNADAAGITYRRYVYVCIFWLVAFLLIYASLPRISKLLSNKKIAKKIHAELLILATLTTKQLLTTLLYSVARYGIFCLQFYFMLMFWNIQLHPAEALIVIPLNYLFITVTPSMAFSEVATRALYAVIFVGYFSPDTFSIACAGVMLWIINFAVPMIAGSVFFAKVKR